MKKGTAAGIPFSPETTTIAATEVTEAIPVMHVDKISVSVLYTAAATGNAVIEGMATKGGTDFEELSAQAIPTNGLLRTYSVERSFALPFIRVRNSTNQPITATIMY
jgi:hypothetical protein